MSAVVESTSRVGGVLARGVQAYRLAISPWLNLGGGCRFYPSCSEYAAIVLRRDGALRGGWKALKRLSRCTPLQRGGLDLP